MVEEKFIGARWFRQRILLSTLSGKSIRIDDIRTMEECPGIKGRLYSSSPLNLARFRSQFPETY